MGDVTAKEARDAEKRQMFDEAEAIAAEAEQREEQQAALREPESSLPASDLSPQPAPVLPAAVETNTPDPGLPLSPTLEPAVQEPDAGFPAGPAQEAPVQADSGPPEVLPVSEPLRIPQPTFDPQNVLTPPMAPPNP